MASQTAHHSAAAMDDDLRKNLSARLKAVEGQVRGLSRMVDDGRYCVEILTQYTATILRPASPMICNQIRQIG